MNRRTFLTAGTLALSYALIGCSPSSDADLRVRLLENSIPAELLKEFERRVARGKDLRLLPSKQLADLFQLLQTWKPGDEAKSQGGLPLPFTNRRSAPVADVITLGDAWLTRSIQQGLLQPLRTDDLKDFQALPDSYQAFVKRDRQGQLAANGDIWAAPYRTGTLMIAYRRKDFEELGWKPQDWADLWRSELQRKISLPDSARAVMGLTLKKLGRSINADDLNAIPQLAAELEALNRQVKFYGSTDYLQPLLIGDTWAAVGWSTEILRQAKRDRRIQAVIPSSGTILTADLWVRPAEASNDATRQTLEQDWISFFWQPQIAEQLSLLSLAASPVLLKGDRASLPESLRQNQNLLPSQAVLEKSEFLLPLSEQAIAQYQQLWTSVRL
ncbi:extracellular solute-binding protein [Leptolyngbya ohadii]|uniref:extracellular solute-binding protein n=1 Tax=Leptolyngbya ohadii TaxID=1962290 RepID=UPI000B5A1270|nr:extracellular solute-binding protein [Leptolyngbya ohadii]